MVVSDGLEDWFPHISPDGKKMVYIGYPAGTPTHNPRTVQIELKLVAINHGEVAASPKTLVKAIGGQGTMNVNSWAPDSMRFAYVIYEVLGRVGTVMVCRDRVSVSIDAKFELFQNYAVKKFGRLSRPTHSPNSADTRLSRFLGSGLLPACVACTIPFWE